MRILSPEADALRCESEMRAYAEKVAREATCPPPYNMGGTSMYPPSLPDLAFQHLGARAQCLQGVAPEHHQKTKIDFLSFTVPAGVVENDLGQPINLVRYALSCLFETIQVSPNPKGMHGYPASAVLTIDGVHVGIWCSGAEHGRDYVQITGAGCAMWGEDMYANVADVLQVLSAKINRIDLCVDFYRGEVDYDACLAAYAQGEFKLPKSPNMPVISQVGTSRGLENLGRTVYIGSRKASKMLRCYEKGLEIFARMPQAFREDCTDPQNLVYGEDEGAPPGTIADQWFRIEVEYKAVDLVLPYSMLLDRDAHFSGSYPFCARILGLGDGVRPDRLKKPAEIDSEKMFLHARQGYGNAVHTWRSIGLTDVQILDRLDTGSHNARLVNSGVLLLQMPKDNDIPF